MMMGKIILVRHPNGDDDNDKAVVRRCHQGHPDCAAGRAAIFFQKKNLTIPVNITRQKQK